MNVVAPEEQQQSYWDGFYSQARAPVAPSQFAIFAHAELPNACSLVDLGCGSGRDAFFFAQHGLPVIGVDQSAAAIDVCRVRQNELGLSGCAFVCDSVSNPALASTLLREVERLGRPGPCAVYARFFLHAITDEQERDFLRLAQELVAPRGGFLAVEFRTMRDRQQPKVTPAHYRRFIDPVRFVHRCELAGFALTYFVEGFGFAKHKEDDAHVARCLFDCGNGAT